MIWFFTVVFMLGGQLPVINETYDFPTKQACVENRESKLAQFSHVGQGYLISTCESKEKSKSHSE